MLVEILLFELKYRFSRPATYVYMAVSFTLCFLWVTYSLNTPPSVAPNSPYVLSLLMIVASYLFTLLVSAMMGVSIARDRDNAIEPLLFTKALSKSGYLFGRFSGSFIVLLIVHLFTIIGMFTAFKAYGITHGGSDYAVMLPFNGWHYLHPYLLFSLPNLFFISSLFFMGGVLSRNPIFIYSQGILFIVIYQVVSVYLNLSENLTLVSIVDPLGLQALARELRSWSTIEQNTQLASFTAALAYNRLIWSGLSLVFLAIAYLSFSFVATEKKYKKHRLSAEHVTGEKESAFSPPRLLKTGNEFVGHLYRQSLFYFKLVIREATFITLAIGGTLAFVAKVITTSADYGATFYPTTQYVVDLLDAFTLFLLLIAVIFSGDLIWKERQARLSSVSNSMPYHDSTYILSKLLALALVYACILSAMLLLGLGFQVANGYFGFGLQGFIGSLFAQIFTAVLMVTALSMFIHTLVNHKALAYLITILIIILNSQLGRLGVESELLQFASGTLHQFSAMNGFGPFIAPFVYLRIYWLSASGILIIGAIAFTVPSDETSWKTRVWTGGRRLVNRLAVSTFLLVTICVLSGAAFYYNTRLVKLAAPVETDQPVDADSLHAVASLAPSVTFADLTIELFPSERYFMAEGTYWLKNETENSIVEIPVSIDVSEDMQLQLLKFDRRNSAAGEQQNANQKVYRLERPLAAGDTLRMDFRITFRHNGFSFDQMDTEVVANGSYISSTLLPTVGSGQNYLNVHTTIGTEAGQVATAPGKLVGSWEKGDRSYYEYTTNTPIPPSFSFTSAKYVVERKKLGDIDLEVYYHPAHRQNVERMMAAMENTIAYCTKNFDPYPYDHLRVIEVPGYPRAYSTFAGTIAFSENNEFAIQRPKEAVDVCYYHTAKETARQWWGTQPLEGKGKETLLPGGLSHYAAMKVMKGLLGEREYRQLLTQELQIYAAGRNKGGETNLASGSGESYVFLNKATLAFNRLGNAVGQENLNRSIASWRKNRPAHLLNSAGLLQALDSLVPDSARHLFTDLFHSITLYDNGISTASYTETADGKFMVNVVFKSRKVQADSIGNESPMPMKDMVQLGLTCQAIEGTTPVEVMQSVWVTKELNEVNFVVASRPLTVTIDPWVLLIDKNLKDNTVSVQNSASPGFLLF